MVLLCRGMDTTQEPIQPEQTNQGGRPTAYKKSFDKQVYKLCLLGATDAEIADFFDVAESTINLWKQKHKGFSESIKKGKEIADMAIAEGLFERAKGCTVKTQKAFKIKDRKSVV